MPLLLEGERLAGEAAVEAGLAHQVVKPARRSPRPRRGCSRSPDPLQPWDRDDWAAPAPPDVSAALAPVRRAAIEASLGHYPATFAILDCVEFGLPQSFEGGIRSEMTSFSHLVLRPEPRAMIQTMFLGRVDYERLERKQQLPDWSRRRWLSCRPKSKKPRTTWMRSPPRASPASDVPRSMRERVRPGYWIEGEDPRARASARSAEAHPRRRSVACGRRSDEDLRVADYAAVVQAGYPAYLGGPFAFRSEPFGCH